MKKEITMPGVARRNFSEDNTPRYAYHIEFDRGRENIYRLDLNLPKSQAAKDSKGDSIQKAQGHEELNEVFGFNDMVEAYQVYYDTFNGTVVKKPTDKKKLENFSGQIAVEVRGEVVRKLGYGLEETVKVKSILIPTSSVHSRALEEYFILKEAVRKHNAKIKEELELAKKDKASKLTEKKDTA